MPNPNKLRGDRAELEVQQLFRDHLGVPARRMLGAGRKDDVGDISGVPDLTIQVAAWANVAQAVRVKPIECEEQRQRAGTTFAVSFIRLRGGLWRAVQTPEMFFSMYREVLK